jgi:hypothetical protein
VMVLKVTQRATFRHGLGTGTTLFLLFVCQALPDLSHLDQRGPSCRVLDGLRGVQAVLGEAPVARGGDSLSNIIWQHTPAPEPILCKLGHFQSRSRMRSRRSEFIHAARRRGSRSPARGTRAAAGDFCFLGVILTVVWPPIRYQPRTTQMSKSNSMVDHLNSEKPIALSDAEELIAKLDNEALLAKFLDVNANFIALGPLAQQFQELRYSQLRDEVYRIDLEIHRRALWGTPEHKAIVKSAHDQAWQLVRIARPCALNCPVPESGTGDQEAVDPIVPQDTTSASTSAAVLKSQMGDREPVDPIVLQHTPSALASEAVAESQTADREAADSAAQQDLPAASTSTMPSRTILAAWRDAIFPLGHRPHDAR